MSPEIRSEIKTPEEPIAEINHSQGMLERIRTTARNRLAIAGIGLAATVGAAELSSQKSNEAIASPVVPEVSANGLKQDCVNAAMSPPKFISAEISKPIKSLSGQRMYSYKLKYGPSMPIGGCHDVFAHTGEVRVQSLKATKKNKFSTPWEILFSTASYSPEDINSDTNTGGVVSENFNRLVSISGQERPYKCVKPGNTRAMLVVRHRVSKRTPVLKQKNGHTIKKYPVVSQRVVLKKPMKVRRAC